MNLLSARLKAFFAGTVQRQLIWGVVLVHALLMSLFVFDLSQRQSDFLIDSQVDQARSLARNLSLVSVTPLLSADFSGLQELTLAISRYSGVAYVMVLRPDGRILAHGDSQRRGQYLADVVQFANSTDPTAPVQVLLRSKALADVVVPVWANQKQVGWVRVGVAQGATALRLAAITQSGLMYTALAIALGTVMAWWLARRLTRRLTELARVAHAVSTGQTHNRAEVLGTDEVSHFARALNFMLDALAARTCQEYALQTELQAEKELAQVTLASIGDAVITTNARGQITFLNSAALSLTGWEMQEALGRVVTEVFELLQSGSNALPADSSVLAVLASGVAPVGETYASLIKRNGLVCPIESRTSLILSPSKTVLGSVLVARDVSEKHKAQEHLQWQAEHDTLTGLPNRMLLAERFERALNKARSNHTLLAVCLLDLDNFKPVNDAYGHEVGDALLIAVTARLSQTLRATDTLSRLGGDEFVLLLEESSDMMGLHRFLEHLLEDFAQPFQINQHRIVITASLGVTVFPIDDSDADTLLRHADQSMYVAKQTGRNRYHRFDVQQDRQRESTHQALERVRLAISADELKLHYQPKVNLRTGCVEGFEALLRWLHPQDGMIPPLQFLPLVEQTDVIVDIGEWVIERALTQLEQWAEQGAVWPISVNIAARHFQRSDFLLRLQLILARHPEVSPTLLEFEILESVALSDILAMNTLIASCRALGIGFSLDDFGTGYSSLSYLKRVAVQTLKVDQSFVRDMLEDHDDLALVESIIKIARLFKLSVIAEGVETQEQGLLLLRLGCDRVQGYGIARPMPPEAAFEWARRYQFDPQWCLWGDVRWDLDDLPLLMAENDHVAWIRQIVMALEGAPLELTPQQLMDHHDCRFGLWYDGAGKQRYGCLPEYAVVEPLHQQMHQLAFDVVRLYRSGEMDKAHQQCTALLSCKTHMLLLLEDLRRAALVTLTRPELLRI